MRPIDEYFLQKEEPVKSCLQVLRHLILSLDENITEAWKYGAPFYYYKGKMFCYLWIHKKHYYPYIGIAEGRHLTHPDLLSEKRVRMKILPVDAAADIALEKINTILRQAMALY